MLRKKARLFTGSSLLNLRGKIVANFNSNGKINVNMTTTLQALSDQLKIHTKLQNYWNVGQIDGQPMLGIASRVNQMLLMRRMGWKFNRVNMGSNNPAVNPHFFMTQQGFQTCGRDVFRAYQQHDSRRTTSCGWRGRRSEPRRLSKRQCQSELRHFQWRERIWPNRELADFRYYF